jgi:hypothetical protein
MNNTTRTLAIAAILAATLALGTFATTTTTTQSAFAYLQKKGPQQDNNRGARDNGKGNGNGNTITIQECKQAATQGGFDNDQEQECENLICTHPGENATCVQEGRATTTTTTTTTTAAQAPIKLTCEQCFTKFLTSEQLTTVLGSFLGRNLENTCMATTIGNLDMLVRALNLAKVSTDVQLQLIKCLVNSGIPLFT